jgi:hypothetical protein
MIFKSKKVFILIVVISWILLYFSFVRKELVREEFGIGITNALKKATSTSLKALKTSPQTVQNDDLKKLRERVKNLESRMNQSKNESNIDLIKTKLDKQDERINSQWKY